MCRSDDLVPPVDECVGGFLVGFSEELAGTYIPGFGNEPNIPIALSVTAVLPERSKTRGLGRVIQSPLE